MQAPGYGYTDPMKPKQMGFDPNGFGGAIGQAAMGTMPQGSPPFMAPQMQAQMQPPQMQFGPQFGQQGVQGGFGGGPFAGQRPVWGQWGRQQQGQQQAFNPTRWGG